MPILSHDMRQLYYDVAGAPMAKDAWQKAYPARLPIARTQVLGALVCTEFVGLDHNAATDRRRLIDIPMIYETTATIQVQGFSVVRSFAWSGGFKRSKWWHAVACAFAFAGGVLWWRYLAYRGDADEQETID